MESLDYKYIAQLVTRAQSGDSDAFAELYAATYQREYTFSYRYLRDEYLAQDALQETYILALKNLSKLKDPTLVISWLNQINFRVCYNMNKKYQRYNQEMEEGNEFLDTFSLEEYRGGIYRWSKYNRGCGMQNRCSGIFDQSDFEAAVYGISGYSVKVLQRNEAG